MRLAANIIADHLLFTIMSGFVLSMPGITGIVPIGVLILFTFYFFFSVYPSHLVPIISSTAITVSGIMVYFSPFTFLPQYIIPLQLRILNRQLLAWY